VTALAFLKGSSFVVHTQSRGGDSYSASRRLVAPARQRSAGAGRNAGRDNYWGELNYCQVPNLHKLFSNSPSTF
jgi:hypothetical protein